MPSAFTHSIRHLRGLAGPGSGINDRPHRRFRGWWKKKSGVSPLRILASPSLKGDPSDAATLRVCGSSHLTSNSSGLRVDSAWILYTGCFAKPRILAALITVRVLNEQEAFALEQKSE